MRILHALAALACLMISPMNAKEINVNEHGFRFTTKEPEDFDLAEDYIKFKIIESIELGIIPVQIHDMCDYQRYLYFCGKIKAYQEMLPVFYHME